MKERKKTKSRFLALFLAFVMVFSLIPTTAYAGNEDENQVHLIVENKLYSEEEGAAWDDELINEWVSIDETSSILSCLAGVLDRYGYTSTGIDMNYISEINGVYAGSPDYMSGWMCMLNDWFINEGMEAFTVESGKLSAGDEVRIFFSLDGGEDYGGTWSNNDKTIKGLVFDKGTLAPEFDSATKEYTLTLPTGTEGVVVTPTATNRNFQVRTSIDGMEYKRTETVPVEAGTKITVKCGDSEWPTMNNGEMGSGAEAVPAEEYQITVAYEESNNAPTLKVDTEASEELTLGDVYSIDLSTIFEDADGDDLTYTVSINNAESLEADKEYSYTPETAGVYTLVFKANDGKVDSPEYRVTITVVDEVQNDIVINRQTNNGSFNYIRFTDEGGNPIKGLEYTIEGTTIHVILPHTYDFNGTVKSIYDLSQNDEGLPFISTTNKATGTSKKKAVNNKFTERTETLKNGAASFTFYFYDAVPTANNNNPIEYKINYTIKNNCPYVVNEKSAEAALTAGEKYELDLTNLFADKDGDELAYYVSINDKTSSSVENVYTFTTNIAGTYKLVFTANDGLETSVDSYTVTLTVRNSAVMKTMTVKLPKDLNPTFYVTNGFEAGGDVLGEILTEENTTTEDVTSYVVSYPENAENISIRTEKWGGVSVATGEGSIVTLSKVQFNAVGLMHQDLETVISVKYGDYNATAGTEGYLLETGITYSCTLTPEDSDYAKKTQTIVPEFTTEVHNITMSMSLTNPKTITVPTGATAQLFIYNKYYDYNELTPKGIVQNEDGTSTYYFNTSNRNLTYRASMDGKGTEAGYWTNDVTIDFDNGVNSSKNNTEILDNSVLVNVNGQNHLKMTTGGTYKLKGYRIWEIIRDQTNNLIITPDFHFNILSGDDVISLEAVKSRSNGGSGDTSDWVNVIALKEGTAIIEVTYDAIDVAGGSWPGLYGASDPDRTGLIVVTVGGEDSSVKFGIDGYASQGSLIYSAGNKKAWDAEFDTLYFTGDNGELDFSPTADSAITEVAVSNNKGVNWTTLAADEGTYTANIVSGNNILRVTTENGTAYQVVRGGKVTVTATEVADGSNGNGLIEAGETVRITLDGIYTPIPKMAGNYNPGYKANNQGDSSVHMVYTFNRESVSGAGAQYTFAATANYIEVTIPEDYTEKTIDLSEGYISVGVIGLTNFADGGDSHRNIPDAGCTTRGSQTTFHTRSVLPEITLTIGEETAPNNAPTVAPDAVTEGSIELGQNYAINPETLFADKDGDVLTYTVSVNEGEAVEVTKDYKFTPEEAGTYILKFTARDEEAEVSHVITVTVIKAEEPEPELDFDDISEDEIAGYVTISFEDYGVREEGATGLKYPTPLGMIIEAKKVPYKNDENIAMVTIRLLDALNIGYEYSGTPASGFYLAAITDFVVDNTPYDYMGEFDAGTGSGWMITLNDIFINKGTSDFKANNGDVIRWQYTCQLGKDIGDDYYQDEVEKVEKLIADIGEVTLEDEEAIKAARAAYDALDDIQQESVENYADLVAAEKALEALKTEEPDEPTTEEPDEPTTEEPDEPTTEEPDEPTTEEPDEPTTEEPDEPTTEEPDEPTTEEPDEPTTEEPDEPGTQKPDGGSWMDKIFGNLFDKIFGNWWGDDDDSDNSTEKPEVDEPTTEEPDEPTTEEPDEPGTEDPGTSKPEKPTTGNWLCNLFNKIFGDWNLSWWK